MADERSQRPYRVNEAPARGQPAKPQAMPAASGGDPLAELARLIGQNDPFSEYAREGTRRPPTARLSEPTPAPEWNGQPDRADFEPPPVARDPRRQASPPQRETNGYYGEPAHAVPPPEANYGRPPFGGPQDAGPDLYDMEPDPRGYTNAKAPGYPNDPYHPNNAPHPDEEEDFYDDAPPARRRIGVMAIAVVFALAVVGTAGAFGYRALFGSSGSSLPPPVIKADTAPSKIVPPAAGKDTQTGKLINDRVNDRGLGERLVSREEQPVPVNPDSSQGQGTGVVAGIEPKKVRVQIIRPDQPMADALPTAGASQQRGTAPPPRVASNSPPPTAADAEPAQAPRSVRVVPTTRQAANPPPSNAPLSLSPDASPPPPAARAPAPAAARAPAAAPVAQPAQVAHAAATGGAGAYVQISSQRSEAEAQAAFRGAQSKFPSQLGSRQPVIRRADLGEKGIYFRAMVGPFGNASEASELCSSLKAAGGDCIVQRN